MQGEIVDRGVDLKRLADSDGVTVTLALANGKTIVFADAWASGDWVANASSGLVQARFESRFAEEV